MRTDIIDFDVDRHREPLSSGGFEVPWPIHTAPLLFVVTVHIRHQFATPTPHDPCAEVAIRLVKSHRTPCDAAEKVKQAKRNAV
jgi:hypothetical protein